MSTEPMKLSAWIAANVVKNEMLWRGAAQSQFANWLRLGDEYGEPDVVGTHTSKSILLPVVQYRLENYVVVTARDNFHDYCVSVRAPGDERTLRGPYFHRFMEPIHRDGFFEGFAAEDTYHSYESSQNRFSLCFGRFLELRVLVDECARARFDGVEMLKYLYPPCPTCGSTRIYMTRTSAALPLSCSICCPMCATCGPTSTRFLRETEAASLYLHEESAERGWWWLSGNAGWDPKSGDFKRQFLTREG